jgi:hypothetical protein
MTSNYQTDNYDHRFTVYSEKDHLIRPEMFLPDSEKLKCQVTIRAGNL